MNKERKATQKKEIPTALYFLVKKYNYYLAQNKKTEQKKIYSQIIQFEREAL